MLSALRTGRFYRTKCSWYSFLLEAESTREPQCCHDGFMPMKVSNDTNSDRTSDIPICPKHLDLPNVVDTIVLVIIIIMILTVVFWRCIRSTLVWLF
jgi:hypothetical protein